MPIDVYSSSATPTPAEGRAGPPEFHAPRSSASVTRGAASPPEITSMVNPDGSPPLAIQGSGAPSPARAPGHTHAEGALVGPSVPAAEAVSPSPSSFSWADEEDLISNTSPSKSTPTPAAPRARPVPLESRLSALKLASSRSWTPSGLCNSQLPRGLHSRPRLPSPPLLCRPSALGPKPWDRQGPAAPARRSPRRPAHPPRHKSRRGALPAQEKLVS